MLTIIIFASSLALAALMVLVKAIELKYEKSNFLLALLKKLEPKSAKLMASIKFRCLQIVQSIRYIILVQSKEFLKELLLKIEDKIVEEYKSRQSVIMGQKQIVSNGSVSFYLKKITEHKGSGSKGKIEESL